MNPLNPVLFVRLQEEFGRVLISHEGVGATKRYETDPLTNQLKFKLISGEYYRISCPYCGDTRGRLWISYLWGVLDELTNSTNLWAAHCFNEDCLSTRSRLSDLHDRIYGFKNCNLRGRRLVILQGEEESQTLQAVSLPGLVLPLERMPTTDRVINYLKSRSLDPNDLSKTYQISYCLDADSNYSLAQNRIVIPIFMNNMLVGWQCRYPADLNWKLANIPKYYSRPNMPRRLMLYNFDNARKYPFVVLCEGPTDVWNVGPYSVAAFGKHLSQPQIRLLTEEWEEGVIIILLDGDAQDDTDKLETRLKEENYKGTVIPIKLPLDKDPGDLDNQFLTDCIISSASRVGIDLTKLERRNNERSNIGELSGRATLYRNFGRRSTVTKEPISDHSINSSSDALCRP